MKLETTYRSQFYEKPSTRALAATGEGAAGVAGGEAAEGEAAETGGAPRRHVRVLARFSCAACPACTLRPQGVTLNTGHPSAARNP